MDGHSKKIKISETIKLWISKKESGESGKPLGKHCMYNLAILNEIRAPLYILTFFSLNDWGVKTLKQLFDNYFFNIYWPVSFVCSNCLFRRSPTFGFVLFVGHITYLCKQIKSRHNSFFPFREFIVHTNNNKSIFCLALSGSCIWLTSCLSGHSTTIWSPVAHSCMSSLSCIFPRVRPIL